MTAYWPLPNTTPTNQFTQTNNFSASGVGENQGNRIDSRVDHTFNDRWRTFVRYSFSDESQPAVQQLQQPGVVGRRRRPDLHQDAQPVGRPQLHARADLGAERPLRPEPPLLRRSPAALGRLRPDQLNFPANVINTVDAFEFPRVNVQNFQSLGQNTFTDLVIAPTTHSFNVNATKVWGAHTLKMGSDYRKFLLNFTQLFFPSGQFASTTRSGRSATRTSRAARRARRWRRCCWASRAAST